jgi:hypothetical protein
MPTWPTGPIEYGSFAWLRRETAQLFGLPPDVRLLDHVDRNRVDSVIESALRMVYFPNPTQFTIADATEAQKERLRRAPHQWSFLQRSFAMELQPSIAVYDMPADFANFVDDGITSRSGERIAIVSASHLRQLLAAPEPAVGPPKYAAIEAKLHTGESSQRYEIILYPIPEDAETVAIRYGISPGGLSESRPYPFGGQEHAETFRTCCALLVAQRLEKPTAEAEKAFLDRMAASILMDSHVAQPSPEGVWPVDEPEDGLRINRQYLARLVGRRMGFGPNRHVWTFQQAQIITEAIKTGLRRFYDPPLVPGERYPHQWSFLTPVQEMTMVPDESTMLLPIGFAMLDGPMTYVEADSIPTTIIRYTGEVQVREMQAQYPTATGQPSVVAIRPAHVGDVPGSRFEAVWWPKPDSNYTVRYRSRIHPMMVAMEDGEGDIPGVATDGASVPQGGQSHAQTIIESCLLAADQLRGANTKEAFERFMFSLVPSVGADRQARAAENLGYNSDRSMHTYARDYRDTQERVISYKGYP